MAVQLVIDETDANVAQEIELDWEEGKPVAKARVCSELRIPRASLERLAAKRAIIVSLDGKVTDLSYRHLVVLLSFLWKKYELVTKAKKLLGAKAYNKAMKAGRIKVVFILEMELVLRAQLEAEMERKDLLTTEEVAKIFSVHPATVVRWISKARRLKAIRHGKDWLVPIRSVEEFALSVNSGAAHQKKRLSDKKRKLIEQDVSLTESLRADTLSRIKEILGDDTLGEKSLQFAMCNQQGCPAHPLQDHLKEHYNYGGDMANVMRTGKLKGEKVGKAWHIPFDQMVWAISSICNWTAYPGVRQSQVSYDTMIAYANEGRFGEIRTNLSGDPCIRITMAAKADEICAKVKQEKLAEKSKVMSALRQRQLASRKES